MAALFLQLVRSACPAKLRRIRSQNYSTYGHHLRPVLADPGLRLKGASASLGSPRADWIPDGCPVASAYCHKIANTVSKLQIRLQNYGRTSFAQLAPSVANALLDNFKWRFQSRQKSRKEAFPLFEPAFEIWASRQSGSSKLAKNGLRAPGLNYLCFCPFAKYLHRLMWHGYCAGRAPVSYPA